MNFGQLVIIARATFSILNVMAQKNKTTVVQTDKLLLRYNQKCGVYASKISIWAPMVVFMLNSSKNRSFEFYKILMGWEGSNSNCRIQRISAYK